MSTQTRTADEIYDEIADVTRQLSQFHNADAVESWHGLARLCDRKRDLWRELAELVNGDHHVPMWSVIGAYTAADHCSDLAERYRQFAREAATKTL